MERIMSLGKWVYDSLESVLKCIFPKDLNYCITIAGCYVTIFSLVLQISEKEAEAVKKTEVTINDDHRNVYVASISNHILWNCRAKSPDNSATFYRFAFLAVIIFVVIAYIFTIIWSSVCRREFSHCIGLISSMMLKFSFFLLLITYDISWLDCLGEPLDVDYNEETKTIYFEVTDKSSITFQLIGSIVSAVLLSVCLTLNCIHYCECCSAYCNSECCRNWKCLSTEDKKQTEKIMKFVDSAKAVKKMEDQDN